MSLWMIAWRSIQQRGLASALTAISMALGVMLVVVVLTIHGVVSKSFRSNSTLGYNMIVGARGGSLQLTLNTVYYLSKPVENISYDYYMEFLPAERRAEELQHSLAYKSLEAERLISEVQAIASGAASPGIQSLGSLLALDAVNNASEEELGGSRPGKYAPYCTFVIPLCLGDYFGSYRVVGTTPAFFDDFYYDLDNELKYEIEQGRNFRHFDEEHGYFEAVVGGAVARDMDVNLGDKINPSHGVPGGHTHERQFTVVGILALSGTPNDRAVFINMEGFYLMEDHALDLKKGEDESTEEEAENEADATSLDPLHESHGHTHDHEDKIEPLPVEQRQITSMLVRTNSPIVVPGLVKTINRENVAKAVLPVEEIYGLFNVIVRPIQNALLLLTGMICLVSGVSILVSIYNSMSDRRHEIAVMRALGAGRGTVMSVILFESVILSLGGGLIGWIAAHSMNALASPWVEAQTGVSIAFWSLAPKENILALISYETEWMVYPELLLIPALILLAIIVGFLPAMSAYRTDVAKSLGK